MKKTRIWGALVLATWLSSTVASAHTGPALPPDPTPFTASEAARLKVLVKRIDGIVAPNGLMYAGRGTPGTLVERAITKYGLPNKGAVIAPLEKIVERHPADRGKLLNALVEHLDGWADGKDARMRGFIRRDVGKIREQYGATMDGEPDPGQNWQMRATAVRVSTKPPARTQRVGARVVATSAVLVRPSDALRASSRLALPNATPRLTSALPRR